jgi:hypothetical protein
MPNMKSVLNAHNRHVINNKKESAENNCNCIDKNTCPLSNQCLTKNIVYQANVCSNESAQPPINKFYIGISETSFKIRYANHIKSFKIPKYKNDTELSKEVWRLKDENLNPVVSWKIIKQCDAYNPVTKRCNLCINEKYEILFFKHPNLLNKKSEILSKCRHKNKFLLAQFDTGD